MTKTIVHLDDNPIMLGLVQALIMDLRIIDASLISVNNAIDALAEVTKLVKLGEEVVIITDRDLEDGKKESGIEFVEDVRTLYGAKVPAIMFSGDGEQPSIDKALKAGVNVYVPKGAPDIIKTLPAAVSAAEAKASGQEPTDKDVRILKIANAQIAQTKDTGTQTGV